MNERIQEIVFKELKGRYFLNSSPPHTLILRPFSISKRTRSSELEISCTDVLRARILNISLDEISDYINISLKDVEEIKKNYEMGLYSKIEEKFKQLTENSYYNKANLSEKGENKGQIR